MGRSVRHVRLLLLKTRPDKIALYTHPGAPLVTRGIENRRALSLSERMDLYMRALDPSFGDFRNTTSPDRHVLALYEAKSWHSVLLFWVKRLALQVLVRQFQHSPASSAVGELRFRIARSTSLCNQI